MTALAGTSLPSFTTCGLIVDISIYRQRATSLFRQRVQPNSSPMRRESDTF
jgi:hypothetical protein